jgi:hypothetical protein
MSILLYVLGVLAVLAGFVAIGFGSPASALDFGNTLIAAGTTAIMGGLVTIGLAAVIGRLQRIAEILADPLMHEHVVHPAPPPPAPPKPTRFEGKPARTEPRPAEASAAPFEPRGPSIPPEFPPFSPLPASAPDTAPEPQADKLAAAEEPLPELPEPEPDVHQAEPPAPALEPAVREPELPPKSFFDAVWPEEKALEAPPAEPAAAEPPPEPEPPAAAELPPAPEKQRAAILKSGVVDGMGYTLYVDGSIEAELPQGTLRFASINELRSHLEKNS